MKKFLYYSCLTVSFALTLWVAAALCVAVYIESMFVLLTGFWPCVAAGALFLIADLLKPKKNQIFRINQ